MNRLISTLLALFAASLVLCQPASWAQYTIGRSKLTLSLPAKPKAAPASLGKEGRALILFREAFRALGPGTFTIVTYTKYQIGKKANLDAVIKEVVRDVSAASGGTKPVVQRLKISGKSAVRHTVTYTTSGQTQTLDQVFLADTDRMWQVAVAYSANNPRAKADANRIFKSIRVK